MFKTRSAKGEETRGRIHDTALGLFRERGFEQTTMRDIAAACGMSLGAAYHYFPSKDAIVLDYYEHVSAEHARLVADGVGAVEDVVERVRLAFHTKLEILRHDRALLGALLRYAGDPHHPLSFLGEATRRHRIESIAVFALALDADGKLPEDLARLAPTALWALHMGILLYFLHDGSAGQRRTARLVDGAVELFVSALKVVRLPVVRSLRRRVFDLLEEAKLVPTLDELRHWRLA